jgi:hypothetical protein
MKNLYKKIFLIALVTFSVLGFSKKTFAAVVYDNSAYVHDYGVSSISITGFTIDSGNAGNRAGMVCLTNSGAAWASATGFTVTIGGVAATAISGAELVVGDDRSICFGAAGIPQGTNKTISASWTGAASGWITMGIITATGVNQTTPFNNGNSATSSYGVDTSISITSNSGDLTSTFARIYDGAGTTNQTLKYADPYGYGEGDVGPGSGTVTHTWTAAYTNGLVVGANFVQYVNATQLNAPTLATPNDAATSQSRSVNLVINDTNTSPNESGIIFRIKPAGGSYSYSTQQAADTTSISAATVLGSNLSYGTTYYWSAVAKGDNSTTVDSSYATDNSFTTASATLNAADCSYDEISASLTVASPGDVVHIPSGTCTWTSAEHLNITKAVSLIGAGTSSGSNLTKIIHNVLDDDSTDIPATFNINLTSDQPVRISGIYFDKGDHTGGSYPNEYKEAIHINGSLDNSFTLSQIHIDHNYFNSGINTIFVSGHVYGVIDSNTFVNPDSAIFFEGDDSYSWDRPIVAGTGNALFIEGNTFTLNSSFGAGQSDEMIYPQRGARVVARYNTYNASGFGRNDTPPFATSHPNWGGVAPYYDLYRSQPIYEVYNNSITLDSSYNTMITFRGGSELVYNNTVTKSNPNTPEYSVGFTEEEGWTTGGPFCGVSCPVFVTWPANDQIANSFIWNNTINGDSNNSVYLSNTTANSSGYDDVLIHQNRDYFLHQPESSGAKVSYATNAMCTAAGTPAVCCTGNGTGTCSAGHYDSVIYDTSGANAYYPYTPYTCPNPITGYTGACDSSIVGVSGYNISTYTISYDGNTNTSGTAPSGQTKTNGVDLTLRTNSGSLAKTGYSFSGWNTAADGSGITYATGGQFTTDADTTLYAKWTAVTPTPTPTPTSVPASVSSGGGGSPVMWTLPTLPVGGFKMNINNGALTTSNRIVTLNFNAGADIKKIAISMTGDFTDSSQEDYSASKQLDLCSQFGGSIKNQTCPDGTYTVYVKFYTAYDRSSPAALASTTITLKSGAVSKNTTNLTFSNPFTRNLQYRQSGSDVKRLQIFLNSDPDTKLADTGAGSSGHETTYFGTLTYKAVIKFQEKYTKDVLAPWGFVKGTGYVGKTTLAKLNKLLSKVGPQ